jgi:ATP-binding cassette, subfamily B, bacterial PglK
VKVLESPRLMLDLLPSSERWRLGGVFAVVLVTAALETLGVASILPFMTVVVDPGAAARYPLLHDLAAAAGAHTWRDTVVVAAVGTGVVIALGNLAGLGSLWVQIRFMARTRHRLASELLFAYLRQPYAFHLQRDAASLLKVIQQDVDHVVEQAIQPMLSATACALVVAALLGLLVMQSPLVALVALVTFGGAYSALFLAVRRRQSRLGERASRAGEAWLRGSFEAFGGIKDVIVLDRTEIVGARFAAAYGRFIDAEAAAAATGAMPRYVLEVIAFGAILLLTVVLLLHRDGAVTAAFPVLTLYAFVGYRLVPGLQQLFAAAAALRYAGTSLRTLHAEWHQVGAGGAPPGKTQGVDLRLRERIAVRGVTFTYPGAARPALTDIGLDIRQGESLGLVGRTGAGKSTLADCLLGLFEPDRGTVMIDGQSLTGEAIRAWRSRVGYVAQHLFLANASVAENIAFGMPPEEIDHAAVVQAARLAQLDAFVSRLPDGYATVVGERGVRLSGGERQRIGIARALYRRPDVLVFDEATSALDGLTEEAVMEAVRKLKGDRTIILIAHRLRTLEACDRLVLLEAGRAVAVGTLAELRASSGAFARFAALA